MTLSVSFLRGKSCCTSVAKMQFDAFCSWLGLPVVVSLHCSRILWSRWEAWLADGAWPHGPLMAAPVGADAGGYISSGSEDEGFWKPVRFLVSGHAEDSCLAPVSCWRWWGDPVGGGAGQVLQAPCLLKAAEGGGIGRHRREAKWPRAVAQITGGGNHWMAPMGWGRCCQFPYGGSWELGPQCLVVS